MTERVQAAGLSSGSGEAGSRFSPRDRQILLTAHGIGPQVVVRLEQAGYCSLEQLRLAGADRVTAAICAQVGSPAWANRRRAIWRALEVAERTESWSLQARSA